MAKKITAALSQSVGDDPSKPPESYETEGHLRTLIDAHGIMNDPVKMKAVHKLAGRHHKAVSGIKSLAQLRTVSNQKHLAKGAQLDQLAQGPGAGDAEDSGDSEDAGEE